MYTIRALSEKHPPRYEDSRVPQRAALFSSSPSSLNFSKEEVFRAIRSFPRGSAGGPDGLRPQHLLDLTSASAERGGVVLLSALASFTSHVANGNTPDCIQPYFFGASLIPLSKKDGGVRPIAIGQTLRRVVAKCIGGRVIHSVGGDLAPLQRGCGVPRGCEVAAHASRSFFHHMPSDHVFVKLDFKNVFNSLSRACMIKAVQQFSPDILSFVYLA